jgi:starch-binding outer membrane protein, SusD/RagB family
MNSYKKISILLLGVALLVFPVACDTEYLSPSKPAEEIIEKSVDGLTSLAVGLQRRYSFQRTSIVYNTVAGSGFSTYELRIMNVGNTDEANLNAGKGNVDGNNSVVRQLWTQSFMLIRESDFIFENSSIVADAGYKAGLLAYASIFKALAYGTLATYFEKAPLAIGDSAVFVDRNILLEEAVDLLETLDTDLAVTPIAATFLAKMPPGLDVKNTMYALTARYHTMLGNSNEALAAANKVDLAAKSFFAYDATSPNPIASISIISNNVFQPRNADLGMPSSLKPDASDKRLLFDLVTLTPTPNATDFRAKGFFSTNEGAIPVYLPGEIMLIKAEAYARNDQPADAIVALNAVLTKTPGSDVWGVGADLPPYAGAITQQAILTEIYRQRSIELYMSGLKLEDNRRFGRPDPNAADSERSRTFYPYPFTEVDNNVNTPANPAI